MTVVLVKVSQEKEGKKKHNSPNGKDLCRHCETISFGRLC